MSATALLTEPEVVETFSCFGGTCTVVVRGEGPAGSPLDAAARCKRALLAWHRQFSRFDPTSELSALNRDPRAIVPVTPMMARFVEAALQAAELTGGLVDPTLLGELEEAGYTASTPPPSLPPALAMRLLRPGSVAPGGPSATRHWREVSVDRKAGTVIRPPAVRIDSGGIVKGVFADVLSAVLRGHPGFAIDAAGDVRFGGSDGAPRPLHVQSPFDSSVLHVFEAPRAAAATSGISKRCWLDRHGRMAHHLLDPATGRPAFTGVVQASALAPTAVEAEARAKAAVLSGPGGAAQWLRWGGLVVTASGEVRLIEGVADIDGA